jgi:hypothetical protein
MLDDNGLSVITVKKPDLLEHLRTNREQHRGVFLEALEGFRVQFIKELDSMLADAKAGRDYRRVVNLVEPQDHTRDYDRVIRMLEMSISDQVKISEAEFAQYVLDDWGWKGQFLATSSNYTGKKY